MQEGKGKEEGEVSEEVSDAMKAAVRALRAEERSVQTLRWGTPNNPRVGAMQWERKSGTPAGSLDDCEPCSCSLRRLRFIPGPASLCTAWHGLLSFIPQGI